MPETVLPKKFFSKRVGRNVFGSPPKISVVIPAYNSAENIVETLDSVFAQSFREYEIILVNDGSPDTPQLERAIKTRMDDIIHIRQRNAGAGAARNMGIEHARGEFIAFLDSDDLWNRDFLASQYAFLQRHGLDMVYCDAVLFGTGSPYLRTFMGTAPSVGEANFDSILSRKCSVITSGTLARKNSILKAGMFENGRVHAEDFHLWLRMARSGAKIGYQTKPLLKYRVHQDGLSGNAVERVERSIGAFARVRDTIEITSGQRSLVDNTIKGLEADLAVEQGKAFLLGGEFREAAAAFSSANRHRRSLKLTAVGLMSRIAPRTLLKFYRSNRASEIGFVPRKG